MLDDKSGSVHISNRSAFFIGIGGSGMMPLARYAAGLGWKVSGSDHHITKDKKDKLIKSGIRVLQSHKPENLQGHTHIVYSSAIAASHPERVAARALERTGELKLLHRMDMLDMLVSRCEQGLAIAGTHGKTSTASMAGWSLLELGLDPDILVGGHPLYLESGIRVGNGAYAVFETDESDASFLKSSAPYRLLLNIDHDHLDFYGSFENLCNAFQEFARSGRVIVFNADDNPLRKAMLAVYKTDIKLNNLYWFATQSKKVELLPENLRAHGCLASFEDASDVLQIQKFMGNTVAGVLQAGLPGRHYASNALGLFTILSLMRPDLNSQSILKSLPSFPGVERRLQLLASPCGVHYYDDYGHHPTEIRAVLAALRLRLPAGNALHAIFQPHRYSRTAALYRQFAESLRAADAIYVLPIYSAGEAPMPGIGGEMIVREIQHLAQKAGADLAVPPGQFWQEGVLGPIQKLVQAGDIVVCLGAGDISGKLREFLKLRQ